MYSNAKITPNYTTLLLCWLNNIVQDTLLKIPNGKLTMHFLYSSFNTDEKERESIVDIMSHNFVLGPVFVQH